MKLAKALDIINEIIDNDIEWSDNEEDIQKTLKAYEYEEHYEACEGIKQAIEYAKYLTIKDIKNFIKILKFISNEQRDH